MLKVNGYEGNYKQFFIYDDNGNILYKTERAYELPLEINVPIRNARKINFSKKDCFEIKSSYDGTSFFTNGKDLHIHNSVIDVVKVEEKQCLIAYGETNFKDVYTLKLNYLDGKEITVESDFYTRSVKTEDRINREKIADIMSSCLWGDKSISHYEVEKLLEKLDITIK